MNRSCEGGAQKNDALYRAQILLHFSIHKIYAPEHPVEPPPRPVCTHPLLREGCPYPVNGFLCWGKDGTCLRSEMQRFNASSRRAEQEGGEEIHTDGSM